MKTAMNPGMSLDSEICLAAGTEKRSATASFAALRAALARDHEREAGAAAHEIETRHAREGAGEGEGEGEGEDDDGHHDGAEENTDLAAFLRIPDPAARAPVDALEWLDDQLHDAQAVPRGWRPVALRLRQQLTALEPARRMASSSRPGIRPQLIALTAADPVVAGLLRKANRQALDRCRVCGAPPVRASNVIPAGYCARHVAPIFLRRLIDAVNSPGWLHDKTSKTPLRRARLAMDSGHLPAAIARQWLAEDRAPWLQVIHDALASGAASIPIAPFDRPRLAAWLMQRHEAVVRECEQVAAEETLAPRRAT